MPKGWTGGSAQPLQTPKGLSINKCSSPAKKETRKLKEKHFQGGDGARERGHGWVSGWTGEVGSVSGR